MNAERRRPRFSARILVRYHVWDNRSGQLELGRLSAARACDIGENGLFLGDTDLPAGARLHFFLSLPDGSGCVQGFGKVVHARPRLDENGRPRPGVGVRVMRMTASDRAQLDRYLDQRRVIQDACLAAADVRRRAQEKLRPGTHN